jgi:hypothetical protein
VADRSGDELGRPIAELDRILAVLVEHEVDFVVLGGVAVIYYGYMRLTADVDILPSPAEANMRRLAEALHDLEAVSAGPGGQRRPLDLSQPATLAVGNYFLDTKHGGLDLVNGRHPDLKRYRRIEAASADAAVSGVRIKIISKADLIAMKREAGRPKDLRDIAALTEVERNP